ncbi:hypothetical protein P692DRAFT_20824436 [Suillus brevipes Sb2]|nr:hypothetical protein P692DRAFT_20824436 [Suillus brevipes Sb2]
MSANLLSPMNSSKRNFRHLKLQQKDVDERLRCIEAQLGIEYIKAGDDADIENDEGEQVDDGGQQSSANVKAEKDNQQRASDDALKSKIFRVRTF